jgi:gamma-glutamyltranspeptidase / glutathione hydrolase
MLEMLLAPMFLTVLMAEHADAEEISWRASGRGGVVAAGRDGEAVAAGIRLLTDGGNAADAAAATILAQSVTDYGLFAIGGEIPLLIYDANRQQIKVLSGVGAAPLDNKAIEWFYANGIPSTGSMKAAPVPGAIDLCVTLLRLYGTRSFAEVVAPTLALLDRGEQRWHARLAVTLRKLVEAEQNASGTRQQRLVAARDRFYRGDVADELEAWYIDTGAFLRKRDLEAHETLIEDPVSVEYRGYTVYKCGPWTQGPALCQTLRLLEGFDLALMEHLSPDYIHTVTEALKLGFADRDAYYGDTRFADVPLGALFSDEYTQLRRPLINSTRASLERRPGDPRQMAALRIEPPAAAPGARPPVQDTTTCVVADRWGNVVVATPSCNLLTNRPGPSGVTQGNRVRSLNTNPDHPNRVQPGKRPRVTLTPTLVTRDGKPVIAISVAGGDLQDQTTLNVLLNHIEFGMMPADAVTALRFHTDHMEDSFNPNPDRAAAMIALGRLRLQRGMSGETVANLARRGHQVETVSGPLGHPVMVYLDHATGMMHAAGDPRAPRHVGAIE